METLRMKCVLENISPIHVGCDEVYEPTGFAVNEKEGCLVIFDPLVFIRNLSRADMEKFSGICQKGTIQSILEIYRFLNNRPAKGRKVDVCNGFMDHYQQVLGLPSGRVQSELNRFLIQRTSFCTSDQRPYIPGSAIKGALRTAYLNHLAQKAGDYSTELKQSKKGGSRGPRGQKEHKMLEQFLLNLDGIPPKDRISKDPFRLVKVSDFMPAGDVKTKISYVINKKKKPSEKEARGPFQILEMIQPGSRFTGEIIVEWPPARDAVSHAIELQKLLQSSARFYGEEKAGEDKTLKSIGATPAQLPSGNGYSLIRLGRHSGAESVTIKGYRDIKIMLGKGNKPAFEDHATTLWLASETSKPKTNKFLSAFGWGFFRERTDEMENHLAEEESTYRDRLEQEREDEKIAIEAQRIQETVERERALDAQRLEAERIKAEEERKAAIAAMSPEERDIMEVRDLSTVDNRIIEIFKKIDDFSAENKNKLAEALKARWQAEDKWDLKGKKKKPKQEKKVDKIKGILGG
jgi:CRISPR-associated protein Csm5